MRRLLPLSLGLPVGLLLAALAPSVGIATRRGHVTSGTAPGTSAVVAAATAHSSRTGPPVASAVIVGENVPITAVNAHRISVAAGALKVACTVGPQSPDLAGLRPGQRVARLECKNGTLTRLERS